LSSPKWRASPASSACATPPSDKQAAESTTAILDVSIRNEAEVFMNAMSAVK
jgi:hypothetical protein